MLLLYQKDREQVLSDEEVITLVKESSSPSAAYDMILLMTDAISKARAGRWLAILRRDYPDEFQKFIG